MSFILKWENTDKILRAVLLKQSSSNGYKSWHTYATASLLITVYYGFRCTHNPKFVGSIQNESASVRGMEKDGANEMNEHQTDQCFQRKACGERWSIANTHPTLPPSLYEPNGSIRSKTADGCERRKAKAKPVVNPNRCLDYRWYKWNDSQIAL